MTKTAIMKDFLEKAVLPVVVALFLYSIFSRIFVDNGTMDLFLIWLACGVPFGIGKMFTLIPISCWLNVKRWAAVKPAAPRSRRATSCPASM